MSHATAVNSCLHKKTKRMTLRRLENELFSIKYGVFFVKPPLFCVFLSFSKLSRQPYKISGKQAHRWILHWNHIFLFKIKICRKCHDLWFFKKNLIRKILKTWCSGKKWRPDSDSAQKIAVKMIYFISWAHLVLLPL